jgi:hypothetical protein
MHVSEEDLILHYYGEVADRAPVDAHLAACGQCREEFERLARVLTLVEAEGLNPVEPPGAAFERTVWARLEPQLTRRQSWMQRLFTSTPRWAFAGGIAALILAAFVAGRFSRDVVPAAPQTTAASTDVAERVLVLAVVDHLDRSQMVLLEVLNADFGDDFDLDAEQSLARDLVTANRLYRQTAVRTGDEQTSELLDELERVLVEIANTPQGATKDDLEALRASIASRGVLFKVRVVHSEMRERERQTFLTGGES